MEPELQSEALGRLERQFEIVWQIARAQGTALSRDEVFYVALTALTAHADAGFDRALLFLVNEDARELVGSMAIGPGSAEEAKSLWRSRGPSGVSPEDIAATFRRFQEFPQPLHEMVAVQHISLRERAGILALTALRGMPAEVLDEAARARLRDPVLTQLGLDRFVAISLRARGQPLGILVVGNDPSSRAITKDDVRFLELTASYLALTTEQARLAEQTLTRAGMDSLTTLWNHGRFQQLLAEELSASERHATPLALAILDLDSFKTYNETFGHPAGDRLLVRVAGILREVARRTDHVARYGGEEFAVIFPETPAAEAFEVCERIRTRITQDIADPVTISIGLAAFPEHARIRDRLLFAADMALLQAKRAGKNRTRLPS